MSTINGRVLVHVLPQLFFVELVRVSQISHLFFQVATSIRKYICVKVCLHYTPWKTQHKWINHRLHLYTNYINARALSGMQIVSFKCSYKNPAPLCTISNLPLLLTCVHLNHIYLPAATALNALYQLKSLHNLCLFNVTTADHSDLHIALTVVLSRCSQLRILKIEKSNCTCTPALFKRIWLLCPQLQLLKTSTVWSCYELNHLIDWINEQLALTPLFLRRIHCYLQGVQTKTISLTLTYYLKCQVDYRTHHVIVTPKRNYELAPIYQQLLNSIWCSTAVTARYKIKNSTKQHLLIVNNKKLVKTAFTWKQQKSNHKCSF